MKEKLKVLELFGGIGAPRKALQRLGIEHEVVDYVEIDKFAVKSYNAIFNENYEPQDILTWDKDLKVDMIFHGSPCQDFSLAGKQAGGDKDSGTRSSLLYETVRIVEKLKPKYVIWENVKNVISKKHKHTFDNYLHEMELLGYTNYYQVLNAKDYGIPQNRERVFTVSILESEKYEFPKGNACNNEIDMVEIPQKVKVRKYEVDTEKLKNVLREHKNKSNKIIAESLNKPITLVEHWFRKDNCFSIPDADIWYKLKELLNIETNEFDEAITTFEEKDNIYEKSNRFYYDTGLAPTITSASADEKIIETFTFPPKQDLKLRLKDMLEDEVDEKYYLDKYLDKLIVKDKISENDIKIEATIEQKGWHRLMKDVLSKESICTCLNTMQGGNLEPKVLIKEATKQGYKEAYEGDSVNLSYPESETRRGRVGEQVAQTLQCNDNMGVVDKPKVIGGIGEKKSNKGTQWYQQDRIYDDKVAISVTTVCNPYYKNDLRIRKLTPRETFRLMGFDDADFEKASQVNSNTQLYKQAGNSIVVNVLEEIFKELFKEEI